MKKLLIALTAIACFSILLLSSCGGNGSTGGGENDTLAALGISSSPSIETEAKLEKSVATANGIEMSWNDADKDDFDKAVKWLNNQSFKFFDGVLVLDTALDENGIYTVAYNKIVNGDNDVKRKVFSTLSLDTKTGEMKLDIAVGKIVSLFYESLNSWPSERIQEYLGFSLPECVSPENKYFYDELPSSDGKELQITVFGANQAYLNEYSSLLYNDFVKNGNCYKKEYSNGDFAEIYLHYGEIYNPENLNIGFDPMNPAPDISYMPDYGITIRVEYNRIKGASPKWENLDLSIFKDFNVPAFAGTSYGIADIGETYFSNIKSTIKGIEDMLKLIESYGGYMGSNSEQQIEMLKKQLDGYSQVEYYAVQVYGATSESRLSFEKALLEAGFFGDGIQYNKTMGDFCLEISIINDISSNHSNEIVLHLYLYPTIIKGNF